ncbi:piggyBac transposable element-derived protein 2-like [Cherax quadricarinatus]|uniref:piggyBac transposable element-derived protein 2-like n=1 Tax=Cherax quadricarinatus TaxID=27406 RepID=UPI00387E8E8F
MSFHERLFYGEQSTSRSRYVCVSEDSDSEPEVDEPELLDSGDEYLPPDAQDAEMSSDDEEEERKERPAKKQKVMRKKKTFRIEEYPDEEEIHENIALQVSSEWTVDDIENDPLPAYEHEKPLAIRSPYEYFRMFVTPAMIDNIAYQTNLYTRQQDVNSTFSTDSEEIMRFIGILLFMGIASLPSLEDYWKAAFRSQQVADSMASKRFRYLRSHIHFNDNTKKDNDRFYKGQYLERYEATKLALGDHLAAT